MAGGGVCARKQIARLSRSRAAGHRSDDTGGRAARCEDLPRQPDHRARSSARRLTAKLNVALVHDYLNQRGGAERVFARIAQIWPDAPVYTALYDLAATGDLVAPHRIRLSYLAGIPGANRFFRVLAPLYPRAFERFDLSAFDTIVSSTTAWAKGVIVPRGAVHVCYINTVSRFTFAYDEYVGSRLARPIVSRLVAWDKRAAARPTCFVANSRNVAERIRRYYGRESEVLHCPVEVDRFTLGSGAGDYFIVVSRLLPYKHVERAIVAAAQAGVKLFVVGTGPAERSLRRLARGTTTTLLGYVDDARMNDLIGNARAMIVPGEEDFGLAPLEAAAAGRPTIALRAGGARETVVEGTTGWFFDQPAPEALAALLASFEASRFAPERLRAHAQRFAPPQFMERLRSIVERVRNELPSLA
ncbi:MAG: glycosyltransferase [Candidatus Eremiobacteraeota bacterium]|nr:glycosyltransferase [Candidatus Eremiobacteraeota bacterium]